MVELLALIIAILGIYLGATGASWWIIFILAAVGTVLYFLMRTSQIIADIQRGRALVAFPLYYAAQVATAAVLFGAGRLLSIIWS